MATRFDNLLDEFGKLPKRPERQPTFLEIAGCAHRENACSDILAFFMDPANPHGLGTLFLDALARTGGIQNQETTASNISVNREGATNARKRIDLLIQSDSHAILIENKIFAGVDNPLGDYAKYLDCLKPTARHKHKFLLTLTPSDEGASHGFKNITHQQLVKEIRGLLGSYVPDADTRYLTFVLDFLNTLDNLNRGTVMGQEFLDFLALRRNDTENFLREINGFKDELRKKIHGLADLVDVQSNVRQLPWRKKDELFDILGHHIRLASDLEVAVDTFISPDGWKITFHARIGTNEELEKLLQRLEIPFQKEDGKRLIHPNRFEYAEDLNRIAPVVRKVVRKLAESDRVA